eukprot:3913976-Alexandrium_andersonii.AAC.1
MPACLSGDIRLPSLAFPRFTSRSLSTILSHSCLRTGSLLAVAAFASLRIPLLSTFLFWLPSARSSPD